MSTNVTPEAYEAALNTVLTYIAEDQEHPLIADAVQPDGTLYTEGKNVFWAAGTDTIELNGTFTLEELLAICTHIQDAQDEE